MPITRTNDERRRARRRLRRHLRAKLAEILKEDFGYEPEPQPGDLILGGDEPAGIGTDSYDMRYSMLLCDMEDR